MGRASGPCGSQRREDKGTRPTSSRLWDPDSESSIREADSLRKHRQHIISLLAYKRQHIISLLALNTMPPRLRLGEVQ